MPIRQIERNDLFFCFHCFLPFISIYSRFFCFFPCLPAADEGANFMVKNISVQLCPNRLPSLLFHHSSQRISDKFRGRNKFMIDIITVVSSIQSTRYHFVTLSQFFRRRRRWCEAWEEEYFGFYYVALCDLHWHTHIHRLLPYCGTAKTSIHH